jgi:chromosomal replication initiator protein
MTAETNTTEDLKELWRRGRAVLRHQLGEQLFKDGIDAIRPVSMDEARIVLACRSEKQCDHIVTRYGACIANVLAYLSKIERKVDFTFDTNPARLAVDNPDGDAVGAEPLLVEGSGRLDRRLTFMNFVRRASNMMAFNVAQAVAEGGAASANPLFLFGPAGFGKTHLLQAMIWRLCGRDPAKRVLFLTAEAFVQQFLTSLHARETIAFKDLVRNVDVFVCDDLQGLRNQAASIEEFYHSIDDLLAHGKQVILAADTPPSSMEHLPNRLRSRLLAGGGVEIRAGDYDLRLAIVRAIAARRAREKPAFAVGDNVLRLIAASIKKDVRILGGALSRLEACSEHGKAPITFESAQAWLSDYLSQQRKVFTVNAIKQHVATRYRVRVSDIDSKSRRHEVLLPRQVAMYLTRRLTARSFPELGRSFKRDHSTILHGYEKIRDRCLQDPVFAADIEELVRALQE